MIAEFEEMREQVLASLMRSLAAPRQQAEQEVNQLLQSTVKKAFNERDTVLRGADAWEMNLDDREELASDLPSIEEERVERESIAASRENLERQRKEAHEAFRRRQEIFAEMLRHVRASAKVPLHEETLTLVRQFNERDENHPEGRLAALMEMGAARFEAFYGVNPEYAPEQTAPAFTGDFDFMRTPSTSTPRTPAVQIEHTAPSHERSVDTDKVAVERAPEHRRQQVAIAGPIDKPAREDELGFDF